MTGVLSCVWAIRQDHSQWEAAGQSKKESLTLKPNWMISYKHRLTNDPANFFCRHNHQLSICAPIRTLPPIVHTTWPLTASFQVSSALAPDRFSGKENDRIMLPPHGSQLLVLLCINFEERMPLTVPSFSDCMILVGQDKNKHTNISCGANICCMSTMH